ncbi:CD59 glycoprotein-like [Antennarius striatus]|uniref:CD59 glycoprotein-like n=1 Tax=Antennarius striatus TaxID=241820 RepID=UPI0035B064FE
MKASAVFLLAASFAIFGLGLSLECYSCPNGTPNDCEVRSVCNAGEDSCLKLTSGENTYTRCIRYSDCNFMTLASRYILREFTFDCCQSNGCNKKKSSSIFGGLFG